MEGRHTRGKTLLYIQLYNNNNNNNNDNNSSNNKQKTNTTQHKPQSLRSGWRYKGLSHAYHYHQYHHYHHHHLSHHHHHWEGNSGHVCSMSYLNLTTLHVPPPPAIPILHPLPVHRPHATPFSPSPQTHPCIISSEAILQWTPLLAVHIPVSGFGGSMLMKGGSSMKVICRRKKRMLRKLELGRERKTP